MKRKVLALLMVSTMVASVFAGCGAKGNTSTEANGTSDDPKTLTVYAWDENFNIPALKAAEADYQKNVDKDFKLEIVTQADSKAVEQAVTLAGNDGKYDTLPDIVLFQDHYFQQYATNYPDAWQDVNDADVNWSDFSQEKLSFSTLDGKHYGFPVDNGTVVMAYRTDLLEQVGRTVDSMKGITWTEYMQVAKEVKEKTGKYMLSMDGSGNDLMYMMAQAEGISQFKDGDSNIAGNDVLEQLCQVIVDMDKEGTLCLAADWTGYTNETIMKDQVASVMNGNWIIPTIKQVKENSGKWAITSMPTLKGGEGYASNGGSSLYVTANCKKVDLAKDFLAKTFGGSTETYDPALKNGGVITCNAVAGKSAVYQEPDEYFNGQAIYATIVEMGTHVKTVEQSDYHYTAREKLGAALTKVKAGEIGSVKEALETADKELRFAMGK